MDAGEPQKPVFFVTGATGSGKSSAAVLLALELRKSWHYEEVVIVNCDVMQFYSELPIATNKGSKESVSGVPHVFLGFLRADDSWAFSPYQDYYTGNNTIPGSDAMENRRVTESFTPHLYVKLVSGYIESFFARVPKGAVIICGGTCYYLQALLFTNTLVDGSDEDTGDGASGSLTCGDSTTYNDSDEGQLTISNQELWEQLNSIDPDAAQRYHPNDSRRIRRLLAIYRDKGIPPSDLYRSRKPTLRYDRSRVFILWTSSERDRLNLRLRERVDEMVRQGLLSECREFLKLYREVKEVGVIKEAIGYKQFASLPNTTLEQEDCVDVVAAVERVKTETIQYARKQERWIVNRISALLKNVSPELPPYHFVRLDVDTLGDAKDAIARVACCFMNSGEHSDCPYLSFPLECPDTAKPPVSQTHCDICKLIVYGRDQWEVHLHSKRHRGMVKRLRLEKEQLEKFGRVLPPSKRRREE